MSAATLAPDPVTAQAPLYPRGPMERTLHGAQAPETRTSEGWIAALRSAGPVREEAIAELHGLLLRGARFELGRRRATLRHLRSEDLNDIATQAADDALLAVLGKLDQFRGASRFTTWAYKFALLEAGVALRRRAWQGREVVLEPDAWPAVSDDRASVQEMLERGELLAALKLAVDSELTQHQREVFVALALNQVPIDVLAERWNTTRGALYKSLHDARARLRKALEAQGLLDGTREGDR